MSMDQMALGEYVEWPKTKAHHGLFLQVTSWGSQDNFLMMYFSVTITPLLKITK